ncbi:MAG: hypothetical protein GXP55_20825 [Deltaproteobacteria bacterium]|nr:hypothetical protein [Deltaproteobacteria bacterium]
MNTPYEHARRGCVIVAGEPDIGCAVASRFAWGGFAPALLIERPRRASERLALDSGPERHISVHHAIPDDADGLLAAMDEAEAQVGLPAIVCYVARPPEGGEDASFSDHLDALMANVACASLLAREFVPRIAEAGGGAFLMVATDTAGRESSGLMALVAALRRSVHGRCVDAELVHPASLLGASGLGSSAPLDFADACWRARVRSTRDPSRRPWLN